MSQQTGLPPAPPPPPPVRGPQQEGCLEALVVLGHCRACGPAGRYRSCGSPGGPSQPRSADEPTRTPASTTSPSPASTPASPRWLITPDEVAEALPDRYMDAICPTLDILPRELLLRRFAQGYKKGGNVPGMPPAGLVFEAIERLCGSNPERVGSQPSRGARLRVCRAVAKVTSSLELPQSSPQLNALTCGSSRPYKAKVGVRDPQRPPSRVLSKDPNLTKVTVKGRDVLRVATGRIERRRIGYSRGEESVLI